MEVYKLNSFLIQTKESGYPRDVEDQPLGYFSSVEKAEAAMRGFAKESEGAASVVEERVHSFTLARIGVDIPIDERFDEVITVYDGRGRLHGHRKSFAEPFYGTDAVDCRFEREQLVEFIDEWKNLQVGIVASLPMSTGEFKRASAALSKALPGVHLDQSDNTYLVLYDEDNHEHIPEAFLFRPGSRVNRSTRRLLLQRFQRYVAEKSQRNCNQLRRKTKGCES